MNATPKILTALTAILCLALGGVPMTAAGVLQEDGAAPSPRPIETILKDIDRLGSRATQDLFDEVVRHASPTAWTELRTHYDSIKSDQVRRLMFTSLLGFQEDGSITKDITKWLGKECLAEEVRTARAAASALGQFGAQGADAAELVIKGKVAKPVAAAVLRCILKRALERSPEGDLRLLVAHAILDTTGTEEELIDALSQFGDSKSLARMAKTLDQRSVTEPIKRCIMKALGKIDSPRSLGVLHERISDSKNSGLIIAIETLQTSSYRKHNRDLEALFGHSSPEIAAAAWVGRASLTKSGQPWIKDLMKLISSDDAAQRTVAVLGAAGILRSGRFSKLDKKSVGIFNKGVADADPAVRAASVSSALALRRKDLTVVLFDAVEVTDAAERETNNRALQFLTGADLGNSTARWKAWWKKEGGKAPLPSFEEAEQAHKQRGRVKNAAARTSFYGLNIEGDSIYFVLDASGSMGSKNYWEETRLEIAKQQVAGALKRMEEGVNFNIIFFGSSMRRFSEEMSILSPEVRQEAIEFVADQGYLGGTAIYDALQAAFEDPTMSTLYVLSDGAPSGGSINNTDDIRSEVAGWNEDRGVVLNCISVGYHSAFLFDLAEENGGQFMESE